MYMYLSNYVYLIPDVTYGRTLSYFFSNIKKGEKRDLPISCLIISTGSLFRLSSSSLLNKMQNALPHIPTEETPINYM